MAVREFETFDRCPTCGNDKPRTIVGPRLLGDLTKEGATQNEQDAAVMIRALLVEIAEAKK